MVVLSILIKKKSQAWALDLTIATTVFLVGIIAVYIYTFNFSNEAETKLEDLFYEGGLVSDTLLSEGTPQNWTFGDCFMPGLLSNNQISDAKLGNLSELFSVDPFGTRKKLNTRFNFCFNITGGFSNFPSGICTETMNNPENLIRIERFTIYQNRPVSFELFMWGNN